MGALLSCPAATERLFTQPPSTKTSPFIQVSTVYACVRVIAETVASLPLNVFEATDKGGVKALEHPLQHLLHDEPNPEMTSFIWRETMLSHLLLWGNAYCQIIRTGRNGIAGLYPLLPDHMEVDRDSRGRLTYTYTTSEGRKMCIRDRRRTLRRERSSHMQTDIFPIVQDAAGRFSESMPA